jgi:hypothetical protein
MGPKPQTPQSGDLFRFPLAEHLNPKHELVLLGDAIVSGRPIIPTCGRRIFPTHGNPPNFHRGEK